MLYFWSRSITFDLSSPPLPPSPGSWGLYTFHFQITRNPCTSTVGVLYVYSTKVRSSIGIIGGRHPLCRDGRHGVRVKTSKRGPWFRKTKTVFLKVFLATVFTWTLLNIRKREVLGNDLTLFTTQLEWSLKVENKEQRKRRIVYEPGHTYEFCVVVPSQTLTPISDLNVFVSRIHLLFLNHSFYTKTRLYICILSGV